MGISGPPTSEQHGLGDTLGGLCHLMCDRVPKGLDIVPRRGRAKRAPCARTA